MDQLETRELACFLAVAEELHFGRAAARLGIAQPGLSRTIRRLERRMGVQLLERDSRSTALTPAGEVLAREGRLALDAVAAAVHRTRRAAGQHGPALRLVMKAGGDGGLLPGILAAHGGEPDAPAVEVVLADSGDRARMLRAGEADAALLHSPLDDLRGLDFEELLVEPRVAVLPGEHPLAGRASLRLAELRGEPLPRWHGLPLGGAADGMPGRATGPEVSDLVQLVQLITLGRTVAVLPESVLAPLRHGLVCVPVTDAAPSTLVLAWPEHSRSLAVAAFARTAGAVAARRWGTGAVG